MKTLLATTAITLAMSMSNVAFASATLTESATSYSVEVTLTSEAPAFLSSMAETFYRGDFQSASNAKLNTLTASDLYTGMGASLMASVRSYCL